MKVSLRWMREYIDLPTSDPQELADVFSSLGHEVEGFEVVSPTFEGIVIGRVETVAPHPNADKVRLCTVDTGEGPEQIICGAWNFEAGAIVPVARPGATLDNGSFAITQREIRGVISNGMICSSRELGLGDDHEGIMVLEDSLPIGADFSEFAELPDVVFDLTITPNRPDAMSMIGLARDLGAYYELPVTLPDISDPGGEGDTAITVSIDDPRCPRFTAREVRAVTAGESPLWMQLRLQRAGVRSISNVVDVSNYVMLEMGQPTHAFDLDRVRQSSIVVRAPHEDERLTTLDGVERILEPNHLLVADTEVALSLAGTMGGAESEVSDSTTNVLVEVAAWDPATVMRMSRGLNLRSEASARFERGVDPNLPAVANHRMCRLLVEITGGRIVGDLIDEYPTPIAPWVVELSSTDVARTLGTGLTPDEPAALLRRLGFEVADGDPALVTVPTYRPDVTRPVDLLEEIARLRGFASFPATLPAGAGGGLTVEQRKERRLRSILLGAGLSEAQTFSFHGADALARMGLPAGDPRRSAIEVRNPLREEESLLRTTLLPGLLGSARYNVSHGIDSVALFEIGRVFFDDEDPEFGQVPHQPMHLGFVVIGKTGGGVLAKSAAVDVFHGTALVRLVLEQLHLEPFELAAVDRAPLHPVRGAEVRMDGQTIGHVGELHPRVARAWELPGRVVVGELQLAPLVADRGLWQFAEPSVYPASDFDLAFEVPEGLEAARLLAAIADDVGTLAESVEVFDQFKGGTLAQGAKSLALSVRLRAADRTLTSEETAAVRQSAIDAAAKLGAKLRGA